MRYLICLMLFAAACSSADRTPSAEAPTESTCAYANNSTDDAIQAGGVHWVNLDEGHKVWTKRHGNNPDMKVLLLHGGPSCTHEYMECFESFFPGQNIEFYHYDQLGSYYSDQPTDSSLWTIERFVEEVEQVRVELDLDHSNFYLLGHSWGAFWPWSTL